MDVCDRFGLRTDNHQEFCRGMMRAALELLPETARVSDFLARLRVVEKELAGQLAFSLSSELAPLGEFFVPEAALSDLRRCWEKTGDASRMAGIFAQEKRFEALDAILEDESCSEQDRTARLSALLTAFASRQHRFYRLRYATLRDAREIRRLCARFPFYRDRVLTEYDLGRRTRSSSCPKHSSEAVPTRKHKTTKRTTRTARNETVLYIRPWVPVFEAVEVAPEDGSFEPLSGDFVDACVAGMNRQEGEILCLCLDGQDARYRIRYLVGGQWKDQDEAVFAREEAWLRDRPPIPIRLLDRMPCTADFRARVLDLLRDALGAVLTPAFRMDRVMSLVLSSLPEHGDARTLAGWVYEIVGRLDPREPWTRHHTSLPEKLRGCFLRFDRLATAGHGILFPEAVSPDPTEWERLRERFFWKTMRITIGDDVRVEPLPKREAALPVLEKVAVLEIREKTTLVDVSQLEEEDIPSCFETDHVVYGGVDAFGLFCEAPGYYRTDGGGGGAAALSVSRASPTSRSCSTSSRGTALTTKDRTATRRRKKERTRTTIHKPR
ncbi:hypothetical protein EBZ80_06600 [bacterium]|nr:hypothetical protein [bacterium]